MKKCERFFEQLNGKVILLLLALSLMQAISIKAQTYQVIIYNPPGGFSDTEGEDLGGQQRVGAGRIAGSTDPNDTHAFLWTSDSITPIDLHPSDFTYSRAYDTDGTRQVGYVELNLFPQIMRRAALWNGTANSFTVLSTGFSEALAIAGDQQVGYVDGSFTCSECGTITAINAALWRGSPGTYVNLHPSGIGCARSFAYDTDGVQQVGEGYFPGTSRNYRALLWMGTRQSVVDLSPTNNAFDQTFANAVKNGVQVGYGVNTSAQIVKALLWRGTAASVVELGVGIAHATNGMTHVGETDGGNFRANAFRWDGDTGAGFNLHTLLPAGVYENSRATGIDQAGNITGWAQLPNGRLVGVLWRAASSSNSNAPDFDFDGDGKSDVSVNRSGTWFMQESTSGFRAAQFGLASDKIVPADYDGDGKTDIAVFRDGFWYWLNSSNGSFNAYQFGQAGDVPVPADYTGDGHAEIAVFRGGFWYSLDVANNQFQGVQFGLASDKPVASDYDGDGKADIAVVRQTDGLSTWYIQGTTQGFYGIQFGADTDRLVPADYDGDGKTDVAVFRGGFWYILRSTQGFYGVQFGFASDIPVAADYDGDGRADVAVYRNGVWYLLGSQQGFSAVQFGTTDDRPIPTAYVP